MLLKEREIETFILKARDKKIGIKEVSFRYTHINNSLLIDPNGVGNIILDNEFYDHVAEDLSSIDSYLLSRLTSRFATDMQVDTKVQNDGYFDFQAVKVCLNIAIPIKEKDNLDSYLYRSFKKVVSFYPFIQSISFVIHQYRLCNVYINMALDLDKVNSIIEDKLSNNYFNKQILDQWLGVVEEITVHAQNEHSYRFKLPIIKGKMRFDMREEGMRGLFQL